MMMWSSRNLELLLTFDVPVAVYFSSEGLAGANLGLAMDLRLAVFLALVLELAALSPPHEVFFLETAFLLAALRSLSASLLALDSLLSFLSDSDFRLFSCSFLPSSVRP